MKRIKCAMTFIPTMKINQITMTLSCRILLLTPLLFSGILAFSQSTQDIQVIAQQCIEIEELKPFWKKMHDSFGDYYVCTDDVLPSSIVLTLNEKNVILAKKEDLFFHAVDEYLVFKKIAFKDDKCHVVFGDFNFLFEREFSNTGGQWVMEPDKH